MKVYSEIDGWFDYENVYRFLVTQCAFGGTFVECGAWLGKSSAYLIDISEYKQLNIYIVDSWRGSPNELHSTHQLATVSDVHELFITNMGTRKFKDIKALSNEAILQFNDESCDVVFIDMEHTYNAVKKDIELWLPKVKSGGYIAGHDYCKGWEGVMRAVDEKFRDKITVDQNCWIYRKE
jgi:predicted O-methyltransferase YrrM